MSEYGLQSARETAQTTGDDMQAIINSALAQDVEFNPVAVATQLLKARDLSAPRAETIARTETYTAYKTEQISASSETSRVMLKASVETGSVAPAMPWNRETVTLPCRTLAPLKKVQRDAAGDASYAL